MKRTLNYFIIFILISFWLINLSMWLVAQEYFTFNLSVLLGTSLMTIVYGIWKRNKIKQMYHSKFYRNAFSNSVTIILVFFILCMVNYLVDKNDYSFDFTKVKLHTLADQSKKVVSQLNQGELKMTLFAKREDWNRYLRLLDLYKYENPLIKVNAIDVDKDPALVKLNNVKSNGTLIIDYQGKQFKSVVKDELGVTNLLMKILRPNKLVLYYITGHNEVDIHSEDLNGASFLKKALLGANYEIKNLELNFPVPKDAAGVIILNPKVSFLEIELKNLKEYLMRGGNLLSTLSPQFNQIVNQGYLDLLDGYGAKFINGIILDRLASTQGGQPTVPIVNSYPEDHSITENFEGRTVFPVSSFFELKKNQQYSWRALVQSTPFPASWGEISFEEVKSGNSFYHKERDYKGPLNIMAVGEFKESRIVLYASTSFISNQFQGQANNFNFFLNSLAWMVDDEALVSLDRSELKGNLVFISEMQLSMVFYFVILGFPFIFFIIAIFSYRAKLGR